jgi:three-Cys-motif partner protein
MPKSPHKQWIANKLGLLNEHADSLVELEPGVTNSYSALTALKLIVLSAGVDVFSSIVPQDYDHSYYLDLFAGAGATKVEDTDFTVVGSPILAPVMAHDHFNEYHFVDNDPEKVAALRGRLDYIHGSTSVDLPREDCYVHKMEAKKFVHDFLDDIKIETNGYSGFNAFTFIDPEGLDPPWHVTRRIAELYGDLLIHYPESGANRNFNTEKAKQYYPSAINPENSDERVRKRGYLDGLESCKYTDITIPIRIDSGKSSRNYHYDLFYATRETPQGSPYKAAMQSMKRKIELLDGDDIQRVIRVLEGDTKSLAGFFPDDGPEDLDNYI